MTLVAKLLSVQVQDCSQDGNKLGVHLRVQLTLVTAEDLFHDYSFPLITRSTL